MLLRHSFLAAFALICSSQTFGSSALAQTSHAPTPPSGMLKPLRIIPVAPPRLEPLAGSVQATPSIPTPKPAGPIVELAAKRAVPIPPPLPTMIAIDLPADTAGPQTPPSASERITKSTPPLPDAVAVPDAVEVVDATASQGTPNQGNPSQATANQIVTPQAATAVSQPVSAPLAETKHGIAQVVVQPPFVQPTNPNRYLFVVENTGQLDMASTIVNLSVPHGVTIKQVSPKSVITEGRKVLVELGSLKAGSKSLIEVEVESADQIVEFTSKLFLESVDGTAAALAQTSQAQAQLQKLVQQTNLISEMLKSSPIASRPAVSAVSPVWQSTAVVNSTNFSQAAGRELHVAYNEPVEPKILMDHAKLTATIDGPVILGQGQKSFFEINVKNPNRTAAENVIVQLTIPKGLEVVVLDREAWFDDRANTLSWEVKEIAAGQSESIRYQAVARIAGQQNQKISIGMDDEFQSKAQLVTLINQ